MRAACSSYYPLTDDTWQSLVEHCNVISVPANEVIYRVDDTPESFAFIYKGLFRAFITDEEGKEYNKRFFVENSFPGVMASLLLSAPSQFTVESLEDSQLILINHKGYRDILNSSMDLQRYHIQYLEKNWLIKQEQREISLVLESATQRYQRFLADNPNIDKRIPLFHIASHLGITPTQLSRTRKEINSG